ncbi:FkbM family methyltransferase [Empedobacter tilapiae]
MKKADLLKTTITSINAQIIDKKKRFLISFYSHYFLKIFKIKNLIPFPEAKFKFQNIVLNTRKNTIDFWACLESYEPDLTYFLMDVLKDNKGTFIDVGGHIGRFTVLTAKNNWDVITFEPVKSNYEMILKNLKGNNCFDSATVYNYGLGDKKQKQTIFYNSSELGESSVVMTDDKKESSEIQIVDFDTFIENKNFKEICVVKIDIEGNEEKAINGMKDFIANQKPLLILELWEENSKDVADFLHSLGYKKLHIFWFIESKHGHYMEKMYNFYNKYTLRYDYQ